MTHQTSQPSLLESLEGRTLMSADLLPAVQKDAGGGDTLLPAVQKDGRPQASAFMTANGVPPDSFTSSDPLPPGFELKAIATMKTSGDGVAMTWHETQVTNNGPNVVVTDTLPANTGVRGEMLNNKYPENMKHEVREHVQFQMDLRAGDANATAGSGAQLEWADSTLQDIVGDPGDSYPSDW